MKKTFAVFLIVIVALAAKSQAPSQLIKINILSPIVRTLYLTYEKTVGKDKSFAIGAAYTGYSTSGTSFSGFSITPEYRFYLSNTDAPEGVFVAPCLRYQNYTLSDDVGDKGTLSTFGGGLIIGKQWIFKSKFALETFIGPIYNSGSVSVTTNSGGSLATGGTDGFGLRLGLNFGIGF
jgi:hypothetical protein